MTNPEILVKLRKANGLSQTDVAKMASDGYGLLTRAAISHYERGTRALPPDLFFQLVASINKFHNEHHEKHRELIKQVRF